MSAETTVEPAAGQDTALREYAVTFGVRYRRGGDPHPTLEHPCPADGYLLVEAPDELTARCRVIQAIGNAWAFMYDLPRSAPELDRFQPLGAIARIPWVDGAEPAVTYL